MTASAQPLWLCTARVHSKGSQQEHVTCTAGLEQLARCIYTVEREMLQLMLLLLRASTSSVQGGVLAVACSGDTSHGASSCGLAVESNCEALGAHVVAVGFGQLPFV